MSCSVPFCTESAKRMHSIPNIYAKDWLRILEIPIEKRYTTLRVCSNHFDASDYRDSSNGRFLKKGILPKGRNHYNEEIDIKEEIIKPDEIYCERVLFGTNIISAPSINDDYNIDVKKVEIDNIISTDSIDIDNTNSPSVDPLNSDISIFDEHNIDAGSTTVSCSPGVSSCDEITSPFKLEEPLTEKGSCRNSAGSTTVTCSSHSDVETLSASSSANSNISKHRNYRKRKRLTEKSSTTNTPVDIERNRQCVKRFHTYSKSPEHYIKEVQYLKKRNQNLIVKYKCSLRTISRLRKKVDRLSQKLQASK